MPKDLNDYLRLYASEMADRIIEQFPPLYRPGDPIAPEIERLRRKPYPAQLVAICGILRRWEAARTAAVIAECGTGKTLISLAAMNAHARGKQYNAVVMMPPQLVEKWARECFLTFPQLT